MPTYYEFINARIKAREKSMPDTTDIERMIDAATAQDTFRVLNDTDLADNLLDVDATSYYKAIKRDIVDLKIFLEKNLPDKNILMLLLSEEDANNMKVLFKARLGGLELKDGDLSDAGLQSVDALKALILEDKKNITNSGFENIVNMLKEQLKGNTEPSEIDNVIDKQFYSYMLMLAKSIKNSFVLLYVKKLIDIANIKSFLRSKKLGRNKTFLVSRIIEGGSFDSNKLSDLFEKDVAAASAYLSEIFDKSTRNDFIDIVKNNDLGRLSDLFLRHMQNFFTQIKYSSEGPGIVLQYYFNKMNAYRNIRLVMIGKLNDIEPAKIKEHIII